MRVLLTGGSGQLGTALRGLAPASTVLAAPGRHELDIGDRDAVARYCREFMPDVMVNAAAYTAVDKAESDAQVSWRVNAGGPDNIARAAAHCGVRLFHVSTDYVFDGEHSRPYTPEDATNPLNEYGRGKREGELAVLRHCGESACIVRTSWLYSASGSNFVNTMLHLMRTRDSIRVVDDQIGSPTWVNGLATAIWQLVGREEAKGILHWTDAGVCSWYDFSVAIQEEALAAGLIARAVEITPIPDAEFPTAAKRPRFSVLDKSLCWRILGRTADHWRVALRRMLREVENNVGT